MKRFIPLAVLASGLSQAFAQEPSGAAKQPDPAIQFHVLQSRRVMVGKTPVVLRRVAPPVLPSLPAPVEPQPAQAPRAQEGTQGEPAQGRKGLVLCLAATVLDGKVTELRWSGHKGQYVAYSNIDFNQLTGLNSFQLGDMECLLIASVVNQASPQAGAKVPPLSAFNWSRSEYVIVDDGSNPVPEDDEMQALDALHVYFDSHKQQLAAALARRREAEAQRLGWQQAHPQLPKDMTINYWRNPDQAAKPANLQ